MSLPPLACGVADYSAAVVSVVAAFSAAAVAVMRQAQAPGRGRRTDANEYANGDGQEATAVATQPPTEQGGLQHG